MLTALKNCSEQVLFSWRPFGYFLSALWYFSLFLENCLVSYEILHIFFSLHILDKTLMVVRLKNVIGVLPFAWGYFEFAFFFFCFSFGGEEGRANFHYFSPFLEKGWVCFHDILQEYSWYYSGNYTKNNVACCLQFETILSYFRSHFCPLYSSPCLEKP